MSGQTKLAAFSEDAPKPKQKAYNTEILGTLASEVV